MISIQKVLNLVLARWQRPFALWDEFSMHTILNLFHQFSRWSFFSMFSSNWSVTINLIMVDLSCL